jgi:uncharacterized protein YgiM (DUF1202 family)
MKGLLGTAGLLAMCLSLLSSCNYQDTMHQVGQPMKPPEIRKYVKVNALNLRECPDTQCRIIRVLHQGDGGLVLREDSGWMEMLVDRSDSRGWVAAKYLSAQPVAGVKARKSQQPKPTQPTLPEEEFAQPGRSTPPQLQEELALPETLDISATKPAVLEEFAD